LRKVKKIYQRRDVWVYMYVFISNSVEMSKTEGDDGPLDTTCGEFSIWNKKAI
jgi:hypothetical protein